jgi:hypothetical protein
MANHNIRICDDRWHGRPGDKVSWRNNQDKDCTISQDDGNPWPFTDGPPIGPIPPGGTASTHLTNLSDGDHHYQVDCCKLDRQKTVTVP